MDYAPRAARNYCRPSDVLNFYIMDGPIAQSVMRRVVGRMERSSV